MLASAAVRRLVLKSAAGRPGMVGLCLCQHEQWHSQHRQWHSQQQQQRHHHWQPLAASLVGVGTGMALWLGLNHRTEAASKPEEVEGQIEECGAFVKGLPEYSLDDVAQHSTVEQKVWVAYRHGVYDITQFIKHHPGGDKIMLGAGGSVEPFWVLYAVHKTPHVLRMLEDYRIGNLAAEDVGASVKNMDDPYANDPRRHVTLKPSSKKPFNAEPPLSLLVDSLITPSELFYVRNHLPVPEVDVATYELEVCDELRDREKTFSLADIKKYPKHSVVSAIMCGGNRRSEMTKVRPVKGLSWGQAAVGNAEWSGARLCDVLRDLGVDQSNTEALHVQFEGLDTDPTSAPYGGSIPIEKALDPRGDVLLAYEMNGEPLPRDHGFPLRVVVPGVVGARNVKWLGRITVSKKESDAHWQQRDYKGFAPNVDWDTVDFSKSPAIQEMPVTSAICSPLEGERVRVVDGTITVKGYAWSGGGRKIVRVDVSGDGGHNWQAAQTLHSDESRHPRAWGWTLWTAQIPVQVGADGQVELCVKAVDSQYNTQPEHFENIWNLRGVLSNAYHRVQVKLQ